MTALRTAWTRALDVVFPPRCVGCGAFGAFICDPCVASSQRADGVRCLRCGSPVREEACQRCYRHPPQIAGTRSAFTYAGVPRSAVLSLKFAGVSAIAPRMGELMAPTFVAWHPPVDAIVPVPLGGLRKRTRGYNQSELLALEVGRLTGLPVETEVIRRNRSTSPQTEQPDEVARRLNVQGAFGPDRRRPRGSLLLIDDVTTTGATLDACARVLLSAGAARVYALTFTRED